MTVRELISALQKIPDQNLPVVISDENGVDTIKEIIQRADYYASYCQVIELKKA